MTNEVRTKIKQTVKTVTSSKQSATDFLKSAGVLTKSGKLAPHLR